MYTSAKPYFYGTGRRKKSVARVRIVPGTGVIICKHEKMNNYFWRIYHVNFYGKSRDS